MSAAALAANMATHSEARRLSAFVPAYADTMWLLIVGILVFFMQCGFAMLEAGTVRAKNTKNILLKNMLDACIGAIIWWAIGFGVAYDGDNKFIGTASKDGYDDYDGPSFFLKGYVMTDEDTYGGEDSTGYLFAAWWFQYVFAAAAATIVSGAMAERTTLTGYAFYTTIITAFIYPTVVHWAWSSYGWVSPFNSGDGNCACEDCDISDDCPFRGGVMDFAGSGIVHMTGGMAALMGAAIIGPRKGRFDENKKPIEIAGHSSTLCVLGTFILWVGWYGFNPGSTLGISPDGYAVIAARVTVCTTLSAASGGITVLFLNKLLGDKTWNINSVCNGVLAGLVSITASCSVTLPWSAFLIGIIGGFVYFAFSKCVLYICKVDDPLDAFAVHGACGFWGVISAACFATKQYAYSQTYEPQGIFYGGEDALAAAICFLFAVIGWVCTMSALMFLPLKFLGLLRVAADVEEVGMDVSKHGGSAYTS